MSRDPNIPADDLAAVEKALRDLPLQEREVFRLKTGSGLSYAEIGAVLGITPGAAERRLVGALRKLHAALHRRARL